MENNPELHDTEAIRAYIARETARQVAEMNDKSDRVFRAKNSIWLLLLVIVFLEYYLILTLVEANSVDTLGIRLPINFQQRTCPADENRRSATTILRQQQAIAHASTTVA